MNQEKLKQLQAQVRIGGKGTARRKKKVVHRTATTDDKKLQSSLKKLSVSKIRFLMKFFPVENFREMATFLKMFVTKTMSRKKSCQIVLF